MQQFYFSSLDVFESYPVSCISNFLNNKIYLQEMSISFEMLNQKTKTALSCFK